MAAATPEERAQLRADLAALEAQYKAGLRKAAGNTLANADTLALLALPALSLVGVRDETSRRVFQGLEVARQQIARLSGDWRRWAEAGRRDDGTLYGFAQWQDQARVVSKDIRDWTGIGAERTAFVAARQAVEDTQRTLARVAQAVDEALPDAEERAELLFWLKVAGGALGAGVLLVGAAYVARAFK